MGHILVTCPSTCRHQGDASPWHWFTPRHQARTFLWPSAAPKVPPPPHPLPTHFTPPPLQAGLDHSSTLPQIVVIYEGFLYPIHKLFAHRWIPLPTVIVYHPPLAVTHSNPRLFSSTSGAYLPLGSHPVRQDPPRLLKCMLRIMERVQPDIALDTALSGC